MVEESPYPHPTAALVVKPEEYIILPERLSYLNIHLFDNQQIHRVPTAPEQQWPWQFNTFEAGRSNAPRTV
ncbi:hypothetical protein EVAR_85279_1 [Eumeta japonica]|uniref:Uncharacterized protein n=1 Tax=Eumeta variegata TaxID=151549 RepID=A0A4C1V7B2_EUMVA|nr:hypothetical protein EVAR_85279_1 [Eumeta japonica]